MRCECGHQKFEHIYEEGQCRSGFYCSCKKFSCRDRDKNNTKYKTNSAGRMIAFLVVPTGVIEIDELHPYWGIKSFPIFAEFENAATEAMRQMAARLEALERELLKRE